MIYGGAIVGLVYRYLTTYFFSMSKGYVVKTTWGYTSWHGILLASAVFLLVKEVSKKIKISKKVESILKEVSSCSFGVYLIHLLVSRSLISLFDIDQLSWIWRSFGILAVYLISLLGVYILKKIPLFKKVVP